jgi:hypothetical protein
MTIIRDLTPSIKREIIVSKNSGSYGTTRFREASGKIRPIFVPNPHEPNVLEPGELIPNGFQRRFDVSIQNKPRFKVILSEPHEPGLGARRYDASIDCWVKINKRPELPSIARRPKPSATVWSDSTGSFYWVVDRDTGVDMCRFRAQTASRAQTIAALYAVSNHLPAAAAYARPDQ